VGPPERYARFTSTDSRQPIIVHPRKVPVSCTYGRKVVLTSFFTYNPEDLCYVSGT
ncbi:hypothetical protein WG66_007905, partial [Moniliophthora roreri]